MQAELASHAKALRPGVGGGRGHLSCSVAKEIVGMVGAQ